MIGAKTKFTDTSKRVVAAKDKAAFKNLRHAGLSIRKDVVASFQRAKGPSKPGTPPHRHRGRLAYSIWYDADKEEAVVGPAYSRVAGKGLPPWIGRMHEFGGAFGGHAQTKKQKAAGKKPRRVAHYPARPYMAPALERAKARFHRDWRSSI
jgi:phage gpG-like protein